MLPDLMRPRIAALALALLTAVVLAGTLAACGDNGSEESLVSEGEPIQISDLQYNVQITRFLNPNDTEDSEYLVGLPPAPPGKEYLGVFMVITNGTDTPRPSATDFVVNDTLGNTYDWIKSESPYALQVGADVPAKGQIPDVDSTAGTGPNQGSLVIFLVNDSVSDNRPLEMDIKTFGGDGKVTLDI